MHSVTEALDNIKRFIKKKKRYEEEQICKTGNHWRLVDLKTEPLLYGA